MTVDATSDIYSLGVSWYELLTNKRPSPPAFAAGKAPPPSSNGALNEMIAAMTSYERSARPSVQKIMQFLKIDIEMPGDRVSA